MDEMIKAKGKSFEGAKVSISGSGNVAVYAARKVTELGGKVITMSDSNGFIFDPQGIDLTQVQEIKEIHRGRVKECTGGGTDYTEGCQNIWDVECDIALPCATQNELDKAAAETLVKNGCFAVGEGANMPTTIEGTDVFLKNGVLFAPGKAANAGGVATSALEMSQNSMRMSWTFEEVDARLKDIMINIYRQSADAAAHYGFEDNYVVGANIAGFEKVANAMLAQGIV